MHYGTPELTYIYLHFSERNRKNKREKIQWITYQHSQELKKLQFSVTLLNLKLKDLLGRRICINDGAPIQGDSFIYS